nr:hypothetical protein [Neobacillus sp. Marseille-Q6967]
MKKPISIFILDVSNSSSEEMGDKLTNYLDDVVNGITDWTKNFGHIKVKHRSGDEIIFVAYGYATSYIIAFFISRIWKYQNHKPYFGLSFGDIDTELEKVDIEKWIHPLIKQARFANDLLKQEQVRPLFRYEMDQFYPSNQQSNVGHNPYREEFERLINALLRVQQTFFMEQTTLQELVCSTYFILQQQKAVAHLLGKTPATISSHFRKGKCEEIFSIYTEILVTLHSLEEKYYGDIVVKPHETSKRLMESIRDCLKEEVQVLKDYFTD